jgi:hypothetical protein
MQLRSRLVVLWTVLCASWVLLTYPSALQAQSNTGQIHGVVRDPSGGIVPKATVTARGVSTGVQTDAQTNEQGSYSFPILPIGDYVVSASASGFKVSEHPPVHVVASEAVTIDFQLEIGKSTESVSVSAVAAKVDASTTTSGTTILSSEIADLPLLVQGGARSGLNFISALPGVNGGTMGTINGGPEGGVGYMLDGTMGAYAGHGLTGDSFNPPPEGLAELRLNATNDSEFGANSGVVITAVTKSGTNDLHGDIYWYMRRGFLNAACYYCAGSADQANQNEEGFTVGGPVVLPHIYNGKNKTFFFGTFAKFSYRTRPGGTVLTVPTPQMRTGDFSEWLALGPSRQLYDPNDIILDPGGSGNFVRAPFPGNIIPSTRLSKVSQYYQGFFPQPNQPGLINNWRGTLLPSINDNQKYLVKIDHNFSGGRQRISGAFDLSKSWSISPGNWTGPLATGITYDNFAFRVRVNWQATLGTNKVFSLRAAINRTYVGAVTAPSPAAAVGGQTAGITGTFSPYTPLVTFENGGFGIAPFSGTDANTQDILPVNADLTWAHGNHNMKFGFSFANNNLVSQHCFGCSGGASFGGLTSSGLAGSVGQGYADFLLGAPSVFNIVTPLYTRYMNDEYGFYAQDSWRATPKLTVDIGLRLDIALPPYEVHDRVSYIDLHLTNPEESVSPGARSFFGNCSGCNGMHRIVDNQYPLSPHLGFAYQLKPRTVLRAGYGLSTVNLLGLFESGVQLALGGGSLGFNFSGSYPQSVIGAAGDPPKATWDSPWPVVVPPLPNLSPAINNNNGGAWWAPHDFKTGRSQNISFGIEQELPHSFIMKLGYVGNLTHGLPVAAITRINDLPLKYLPLGDLLNQNILSPAAQAAGYTLPYPTFPTNRRVADAIRPYPQFGGLSNIADNFGFSLYHSFQATVQKRYGDLSFLASYTISKQLNNYDSFSGLGEAYTFSEIQNDALKSQYKKLAINDIPQVLVLSWVYHLPFGPGKKFLNSNNPVVRYGIGGWKLAAIQRYQNGSVIKVTQSNRSIPDMNPIWANRVPGVPIRTGTGCGNYDPSNPSANKYLNVAAFADPAPFTLGNTQFLPNVRTCGYLNEDVSLQKEFKIHERVSVEIAADAQNLFNRHLWTGLNTNIDTVGTFGQYTGTTGPRLMQLHAKIVF